MTPNEFKAWFDGFTEAFEGRIPTKAQWGRIKDRVAEIDGKPVTERVYVDRYWPNSIPYWRYYGTCGNATTTYTANVFSTSASNALAQGSTASLANAGYAFDSSQAMLELGRADAKALAA